MFGMFFFIPFIFFVFLVNCFLIFNYILFKFFLFDMIIDNKNKLYYFFDLNIEIKFRFNMRN